MSAPQDPNFQAPPPPPLAEEEPVAPRPTKKLWPIAIASFVLGLIFLGGAAAKLLPGAWFTAIALCFLGVLLFALSFIRLPLVPNPEAPLSWFEKVIGIFFEPTRVFRNLRSQPLWIGALLTIWVLTMIYSTAFVQRITPERIVEFTMEKITQTPFAPPPEALDRVRQAQLDQLKQPSQRVGTELQSLVGIFVIVCIVAALSFLGILAFGGRINFWQSLAAIFWAAVPVIAIRKILGLVILFLKSPDDLHPMLNRDTTLQDNLGILITPADHPVLFVMASFIGFTSLYGLWLQARGLHLTGTRVSKGTAWGIAITLWLLFLLLRMILAALFPQFIS